VSTPDRFQYHGCDVGQHHYCEGPREHQGPGIPLLVAHDGVDPAADGHYFPSISPIIAKVLAQELPKPRETPKRPQVPRLPARTIIFRL